MFMVYWRVFLESVLASDVALSRFIIQCSKRLNIYVLFRLLK